MPIYIAKDFEGRVESIVQADSALLANTFWQGQNIFPHSTDVIATEIPAGNPYRVRPILKTELVELEVGYKARQVKYRIVLKG
jgi:hypothetical protein